MLGEDQMDRPSLCGVSAKYARAVLGNPFLQTLP